MKFANENPLAQEIIGYMQSYPPKPIYGDGSAGAIGEMGDQANIMDWLRSIGGKLQQKYQENRQWEEDYNKRPGFYDGMPYDQRLKELEKLYPELRNEVSIAPSTLGQDIAMKQEINHTLNPLTGKLEPTPW